MAFVGRPQDRDNDIVLTRPDFSSLKRVGKDPDLLTFGSWSPDGNTIVFTQNTFTKDPPIFDLYTLDIHTGYIRQLTDTPGISEQGAVYSPDGNQIAFMDTPAKNAPGGFGAAYLVIMDSDGKNRRKVLDETIKFFEISWSPDGKKLVFAMGEECTDLYTVNEDGSGLMQLTNMPGNEYNPVWSPDGKWISFVASNECSINAWGWRIYTVTSEGNGLAEIKN